MTTKYTPINKIASSLKKTRTSAYTLPSARYSALKPSYIPLAFHNLKPNTKYRIFVKTNENVIEGKQEDVTRFCIPYGESLRQNNSQKQFTDFMSSPSGDLTILAKPFGAENIDSENQNWANYWKYIHKKSITSDLVRSNFIIVESVKASGTIGQKQKDIKGRAPESIALPILSEKESDNYIKQIIFPNLIQTFFIDPNSTRFSKTVDLTDISLYFRGKPERSSNKSGIADPAVTIAIVDVEDRKPIVTRQHKKSIVKKTWSEISSSSDASVATVFTFSDVVRLEVGKTYGIAVILDDSYLLWDVEVGDILVGTNNISSGSSKGHKGSLFTLTNAAQKIDNTNFETLYTEKTSVDLKFDIHAAEYDTSQPIDVDFVNNDYEFLIIDGSNNFYGNELVYQTQSNETGTFTSVAGTNRLVGTSTTFTNLTINEQIVLTDSANTSKTEVAVVSAIISDTIIETADPILFTRSIGNYQRAVIARVEFYDYYNRLLYLSNSNAGRASGVLPEKKFAKTETIIGIESGEQADIVAISALPLSVFTTNLKLDLPSNFSVQGIYNLAQKDNGSYEINADDTALNLSAPNYNAKYQSYIISKSFEINANNDLFDSGSEILPTISGEVALTIPKSFQMRLTFSNETGVQKTFESPEVEINGLSAETNIWLINNSAANEHTNNGAARTKYISKKLTFNQGQAAEDIRVVVNAYRPLGTDFKVYAKILNPSDPAPFDDKFWTELAFTSGENQFCDPDNLFDFKEFELGFPSTLTSSSTIDGTITAEEGNNVIIGSGTDFVSDLANNEIIKIYDPLFPENYQIVSIDTVDSTTQITLNEEITQANLDAAGLRIDKVVLQNVAFNNTNNFNIVRYYDENGTPYDTYSTVAIKIVLLAENSYVVPRVDDYRVIGVSA